MQPTSALRNSQTLVWSTPPQKWTARHIVDSTCQHTLRLHIYLVLWASICFVSYAKCCLWLTARGLLQMKAHGPPWPQVCVCVCILCMYVYIYISYHMYIYIYMCIYIYIHIICTYMCTRTNTYIYMYKLDSILRLAVAHYLCCLHSSNGCEVYQNKPFAFLFLFSLFLHPML